MDNLNQNAYEKEQTKHTPESRGVPLAVSREQAKRYLMAAGAIVLFLYSGIAYHNVGMFLLAIASCGGVIYFALKDTRRATESGVTFTGVCVDAGNGSIGSILLKIVRTKRTYVFQGEGKTLVLRTPAPIHIRKKGIYRLFLYGVEEQEELLLAEGVAGYQKVGKSKD